VFIGLRSNQKEKSTSLKHKLYIPASSKASKWFDFFHLILTVMPVLLFLTSTVRRNYADIALQSIGRGQADKKRWINGGKPL
jgi:hypothetical protein